MVVGRVAKPHGVHGDLLVEVLTDFPERLADGVRFGVGDDDRPSEYHKAHRVRFHKGRWLVSVEGIRDRAGVDEWRGKLIFLPEQSLDDLPPGYYYEHHLVGLVCRSAEGKDLGEVVGIDTETPQTRLLVRRDRREFQVPYVPEIVLEVNLDAGVMTLDPPKGLLDDEADKA